MPPSPEQQQRTAFVRNLIDELTRDGKHEKEMREIVKKEYEDEFNLKLGRNYYYVLDDYMKSRRIQTDDDDWTKAVKACKYIIAERMEAIKEGYPSPYSKEDADEAKSTLRELYKNHR